MPVASGIAGRANVGRCPASSLLCVCSLWRSSGVVAGHSCGHVTCTVPRVAWESHRILHLLCCTVTTRGLRYVLWENANVSYATSLFLLSWSDTVGLAVVYNGPGHSGCLPCHSHKSHFCGFSHVGVEQFVMQNSLVSITERLQITSEDWAVPAFILFTPSASLTTAYYTTVLWPWSTSLLPSPNGHLSLLLLLLYEGCPAKTYFTNPISSLLWDFV